MPRKNRRRGGCGRSLGFLIVILAFAAAAFLISCRPENPVTTSARRPGVHQPTRQPVQPHDDSANQRHAEHVDEPAPRETPQPKHEASPPPSAPEVQPEKPAAPASEPHAAVSPPKPAVSSGEFLRGTVGDSRVALTFDAGASAVPTPKILDVLAKHNVHATFFLTGKWIEKHPDLVRRIADEGHEIGNHTYSHPRLTTLTDGEIKKEVEKTEHLIVDLTGHSTKPLLRVPYGDRNKQVLATLESLGYRSIYWDVDSWDSVKKGITADEIKSRVIDKARDGSVVLMHCGSAASADALDSLLTELESKGFHQVTVSEMLRT